VSSIYSSHRGRLKGGPKHPPLRIPLLFLLGFEAREAGQISRKNKGRITEGSTSKYGVGNKNKGES
tara:strand:- start:197 stop:394 length:198 start_codon:yes stop_codon:yes gene_type:complete